MTFPSLNQLWFSAKQVFKRFPVSIIFTLIATISAFVLTYYTGNYQLEQPLIKGIYLGNLGLALSLAFTLFLERKPLKIQYKIGGYFLIIVLLTLFYFVFDPFVKDSDVLVLLVLGFAFHLLVSIAAFNSKGEEVGFWQINKVFFLRILTSVLYSAVLYIGLTLAILSIDQLFNVHWSSQIYFRLWILIAGLFNTIFFLSGIPHPTDKLNTDHSYPKALKVFTQYVLIPLATIYLLILLSYELKIAINGVLPKGMVSLLILGYAVFGILSLLLVYPLRNQEENKWIKLFSKSFYVLMIPLLVLLVLAVYKRIEDYGITEGRYILIFLTLWLIFVTTYFLIKGQNQIRIIPISLIALSIGISFGPWGMSAVSMESQQKRLGKLLLLKPETKRNNEIRNLSRYLIDKHGILSVQPFVKQDLNKVNDYYLNLKDTSSKYYSYQYDMRDSVLKLLKISPDYEFESLGVESDKVKYFKNEEEDVLNVAGADKVIAFNSNMNQQSQKTRNFDLGQDHFILGVDSTQRLYLKSSLGIEVVFDMESLLNDLMKSTSFKEVENQSKTYQVPVSNMMIKKEIGKYKFICRFEGINGGYGTNKKEKFLYYSGYLIVVKK